MRYICTSIVATLVLVSTSAADTYTIATNGMTFAPATLDVQPGDIITFEVGPYHTATSGSSCSSDGLFDYGSGTNTWTVPDSVAGTTVDYFCIPHCSMGMTGAINVADIINVPGDHATIQGAIDASSDGDVIAIAAGTYYEHSLNPNGKAITIGSASGNLDVHIDALQGGSVFVIQSWEADTTVIKDLVITGGSSWYGGGIYCYGSWPTISNCTISGNWSSNGGGIFCVDSSPRITDCMISGNTASSGGGIYCDGSSPTISDCTIEGNTATYSGGGIYWDGNWYSNYSTISDCTITGNTANDSGGGIYCQNSWNTIIGSAICGNEPEQINGGHWISGGENDIATSCPVAPTPTGACCVNDGCITSIEADCTTAGGTYAGDDVACADAGCSTPPVTGACCVSSGCVANTNDDCTALGGTWLGEGGSCDDCPASCMGDTDGNGVVNIEDLLNMLGSWGACP